MTNHTVSFLNDLNGMNISDPFDIVTNWDDMVILINENYLNITGYADTGTDSLWSGEIFNFTGNWTASNDDNQRTVNIACLPKPDTSVESMSTTVQNNDDDDGESSKAMSKYCINARLFACFVVLLALINN